MEQRITNKKPSIFIASSGKSLSIAEAVKVYLEHYAICNIWTEDIFKINVSTLDTLLNRASYYDFFIGVFAADDMAVINNETKNVPRDNVIFEFGLFLGRIGLKRTFFIIEEGVDLFSDWHGYTCANFRRGDNLVSSVGVACIKIKMAMELAEKLADYTVLPSTALALGYWHNFLNPLFVALNKGNQQFQVIDKDKPGEVWYKSIDTEHYDTPEIQIRIPENLKVLDRGGLTARIKDFKKVILQTDDRAFPFYANEEPNKSSKLQLFDIPTTLYTSYLAIDKIFSPEFLRSENNLEKLMAKEIDNFKKILLSQKTDSKWQKFSFITID